MANRSNRRNLRTFLNLLDTPSEQVSPQTLSIDLIILPKTQPRRYFDPDKLEQLAESIKAYGILEPLLVRPTHPHPLPEGEYQGTYELVAGERRYRAAQLLGLSEVPVTIRHLSDEDALAVALIENLQREDLNPIEETEAILRLLAFRLGKEIAEAESLLYQLHTAHKKKSANSVIGSDELKLVEDLFATLGQQWLSFVSNKLPLLHLTEDILEALRQGAISYTKAIAISRVKDETQRQELLKVAIAENWSLAKIRKHTRELLHTPLRSKPLPEDKLAKTYNRLSKLRLWESDIKRWSQVEELIDEIEKLIDSFDV